MNIVHVITSLDVGGAELMLLRLCKSLNASGNKNVVICLFSNPETKNRFLNEKIEVIDLQVTKSSGGWLRLLTSFLTIKSQIKMSPDVIQGWLPHGNIFALLLKMVFYRRAALVWNIRQSLHTWGTSSPVTKFLIKLGAFTSNFPDLILYNSHRGCEQHVKIGYAKTKSKVIANGFDLAAFEGAPARGLRASLGIPENGVAIVHLGRRDPTKDHPTFLRAVVPLVMKYPQAYIVCVGRGVNLDDPDLGGLVPPKWRRQFIFLGQRTDVPQILMASDIYCSSSLAEAFSNAIGEAMAAGLPCVVTDVGDSKIIVGDCGWVVPPGDPDELMEALEKVLIIPHEGRRSFGSRARQRVREHYSMERITQEYVETYRGLCKA